MATGTAGRGRAPETVIGPEWWIDIGLAGAASAVALVGVVSFLPVVRSTASAFARRVLVAAALLLGAGVATTLAFLDLSRSYGSPVAWPLMGVAALQLAATGVLTLLIRT